MLRWCAGQVGQVMATTFALSHAAATSDIVPLLVSVHRSLVAHCGLIASAAMWPVEHQAAQGTRPNGMPPRRRVFFEARSGTWRAVAADGSSRAGFCDRASGAEWQSPRDAGKVTPHVASGFV